MNIDPIVDGLQVSAVGMGMTSVVLVLLALSVRAMAWFDDYMRRREAAVAAAESHVAAGDADAEVAADDGAAASLSPDGAARAAAIAVALALARRSAVAAGQPSSSPAQPAPTVASDSWLSEGRARLRAGQGFKPGGEVRR